MEKNVTILPGGMNGKSGKSKGRKIYVLMSFLWHFWHSKSISDACLEQYIALQDGH
jgi:hypothetical protein